MTWHNFKMTSLGLALGRQGGGGVHVIWPWGKATIEYPCLNKH